MSDNIDLTEIKNDEEIKEEVKKTVEAEYEAAENLGDAGTQTAEAVQNTVDNTVAAAGAPAPDTDPYSKYARPAAPYAGGNPYYGYIPQGQPYGYQAQPVNGQGYPQGIPYGQGMQQSPQSMQQGQAEAGDTGENSQPQQPVYQQPYGWVPYPYGYIPGQPGMAPNGPQDAANTKKSKKEKKGSGKVGKFFFGAAMAAVFGIIAGGVFIAITYFYKEKNPELFTEQTSGKARVTVSDNKNNDRLNLTPASDAVKIPSTDVIDNTESTFTSTDVSGVVEKAMPSIVSIECVTRVSSPFYGTYDAATAGSGIIIEKQEKELMIATNNHVVEDAKDIKVTFNDGTTAAATVKGKDDVADLAVIAVKLDDLSADTLKNIAIAKLGNSDDVKIGEIAIAIGNSLGYGQSVTVGYISAKDRDLTIDGQTYSNLLQTDAAINPGNSGGALVNINGEVIGINNAKVGGANVEGMGYAIPISRAQNILADFAARETLSTEEQGFLGVSITTVTNDMGKMYNWPVGAYVSELIEGGAAEKAGIFKGDIITAIDDTKIKSAEALIEKIQSIRYGKEVKVTVQRIEDGEFKEITITVVLGQRPAESTN
jgi:serine protease Do